MVYAFAVDRHADLVGYVTASRRYLASTGVNSDEEVSQLESTIIANFTSVVVHNLIGELAVREAHVSAVLLYSQPQFPSICR